jgi:hypothetical protein
MAANLAFRAYLGPSFGADKVPTEINGAAPAAGQIVN